MPGPSAVRMDLPHDHLTAVRAEVRVRCGTQSGEAHDEVSRIGRDEDAHLWIRWRQYGPRPRVRNGLRIEVLEEFWCPGLAEPLAPRGDLASGNGVGVGDAREATGVHLPIVPVRRPAHVRR